MPMMTTIPTDPWYVYELVDPRGPTVFYIGKTCNPVGRLTQHRNNPLRSLAGRIDEISAAGLAFTMRVVAKFYTEAECFDHERKLIDSTPDLLNKRGKRKCRPPVEDIQFPSPAGLAPGFIAAPRFNGVITIEDGQAIWRSLGKLERRILADVATYGYPVKRGNGYPIRWGYLTNRGIIEWCSMKAMEVLQRKGVMRFHGAAKFVITPLGAFVAKNRFARRGRAAEVSRLYSKAA
jgi:hypothetical protein